MTPNNVNCKCHCIVDEDVDLADGALETLAKVSRGDLRRAITSLQSAVRLKVGDT